MKDFVFKIITPLWLCEFQLKRCSKVTLAPCQCCTKLMVVKIFIAAETTLPLNKHRAIRIFKSCFCVYDHCQYGFVNFCLRDVSRLH